MKRIQQVKERLINSYTENWGNLLSETNYCLTFQDERLTFLPEIIEYFLHDDVVCFEISNYEVTLNVKKENVEIEFVFNLLSDGISFSMNKLITEESVYKYELKNELTDPEYWVPLLYDFYEWLKNHPRYRLRFVTGDLQMQEESLKKEWKCYFPSYQVSERRKSNEYARRSV